MTASNGGSVAAAYAYDPLDRRTEKSGAGVTTTYYLDDEGGTEIGEYTASGTLLRRYVPGPQIDEPIAMVVPGTPETRTYFHEDKTGSVVAMSDDSGNLVSGTGPITYDAFGVSTNLGTSEPYGFTGQRLDPETGLYYYRARYYSTSLGRFLQVDPIGYKNDYNLYTYVGNDPVDKADPSGEDPCDLCTLVFLTFAYIAVEHAVNTPTHNPTPAPTSTTHHNEQGLPPTTTPGPKGPTINEARGPKPIQPVPDAEGPHSVPRPPPGEGPPRGYIEYEPNPNNPTGHDETKRFRGDGKPHGGVEPPLVIEGGKARPARPEEIPKPPTPLPKPVP